MSDAGYEDAGWSDQSSTTKKINQKIILVSAGILLYRVKNERPEVYLVHPGGPFFKNKDDGAWTIPKGIPDEGEVLEDAARREFNEETGGMITGNLLAMGSVKQKSGKIVHAWATVGDAPTGEVVSNLFELEWPPRSGRKQQFPEVDRGEFFDVPTALRKINPDQVPFIERLLHHLKQ